MGERKSDYTGERYGDWAVTGRAKALGGKRYWVLTNTVDDTVMAALQTDLAKGVAVAAPEHPLNQANGVAQAEVKASGAKGDFVRVVTIGEFEGPECTELDGDEDVPEPDPFAGIPSGSLLPEQTILTDADPIVVPPLPADHEMRQPVSYTPKGKNAESAQIAATVIEGNRIAEGWAAALPVDTDMVLVEQEPAEPGIGHRAEETVSEAELDERAPAADPVKLAIRAIMGEVAEIRTDIATLGARSDYLMSLVDEALKAAITR
jgi:hypothetical protein